MKMVLDPEIERLRFLVTDTTLPDYKASTEGRTPEELEATLVTAAQLVIDAVASDTQKPSQFERFPPLLADEMSVLYIRTMAPVGGFAELELFSSEPGSANHTRYTEALTEFNTGCTKIISLYAKQNLPTGPSRRSTVHARRMLLNNHLWMTDRRLVLRIWPGADVMPYMLKAVVVTLNGMLIKAGPALYEVRR